MDKRKYDFGYSPTLLKISDYETGEAAREEESRLLKILSPYLIDTEELKNGNKETFIWEHCEDFLLSI